ncbi:hypothetical protein J27TS8_08020 [Robertmurraya siralis]|uniref:Uncharacterized protein n=1 Tax=Robertmurraya siralis TaxID=77777 RepID=A0A919WFJ4_9BACI|nr:hypothetical protein J27TS8_08020 [Robertmurraya siralis]
MKDMNSLGHTTWNDSLCTKIQKANDLWKIQKEYWTNHKRSMLAISF